MSEENIWRVVNFIVLGVVGWFTYYKTVLQPARLKQSDDDAIHTRKQADATQAFTERSYTDDSHQRVLNETMMLEHILRNNDGRGDKLWEALERLTVAIREGDATHKEGLDQVIANSNKLLTIMSQEQSDRRGLGGSYVDPIMDAFQKSPAVKAVDDVVAAAIEPVIPLEEAGSADKTNSLS